MAIDEKDREVFDGDPERSQARIRELVEQASRVLPAARLNFLSYFIAVCIDDELEQIGCRSKIVRRELDAEMVRMKREFRHLEEQLQ